MILLDANKTINIICLILLLTLLPDQAYAYLGPGLGLGLIGSIIGLLLSIFIFIFALFWIPIKKILNRKKNKKKF
mgnify:CR=1 FL=1